MAVFPRLTFSRGLTHGAKRISSNWRHVRRKLQLASLTQKFIAEPAFGQGCCPYTYGKFSRKIT